jgi:membrane fusion protein (multidrug efflux system)
MKFFVSALPLLIVLLAGCPANDKPRPAEGPARLSTEDDDRLVAVATRRDIEEAVDATGFVESVHAPFDVRAEIGGRVLRLFVDNGTNVTKGQKLLELDDTTPKADFLEATRNAQLSKLELERAERDLTRQESLFAEGFSTEKARLDAKTDADFSRLRLQVAEARAEKARNNLTKTVVVAPFDGFVSDLGVTTDQVISANSSALMRVYDFSRLRVVAKFNEFDAARMTLGKTGTVTFDSLPGASAPGTIGYISPFATSEQNLRVFTAKIDFSPKVAPVRPGVSANVRIVTRRAANVISVPVSAVYIDGGDRLVYLKNTDGSLARHEVKTGFNDSGFVEIREGLAEGDKVSLVRPSAKR